MRGRPKKEENRKIYCQIRLTEKERDELAYMCYKTDSSRSKVIREALRRYSNYVKYLE